MSTGDGPLESWCSACKSEMPEGKFGRLQISVLHSNLELLRSRLVEWDLQQQALELRFTRGFLHWDRAGLLGNEMLLRYPTFTLEKGDPGLVIFVDEATQYRFSYGNILASFVAVAGRPTQDNITSTAKELLDLVIQTYELNTLSRVGNRLIFHLPFESEEAAEDHFEKISQKHGAGAFFLQESGDSRLTGKRLKDFTLRFEDEKTGIRITAQTSKPQRNLSGPEIHLIEPHLPPLKWVLAIDVDVYTVQPLPSSGLLIDLLMKSNLKMLRTRVLPLLE